MPQGHPAATGISPVWIAVQVPWQHCPSTGFSDQCGRFMVTGKKGSESRCFNIMLLFNKTQSKTLEQGFYVHVVSYFQIKHLIEQEKKIRVGLDFIHPLLIRKSEHCVPEWEQSYHRKSKLLHFD